MFWTYDHEAIRTLTVEETEYPCLPLGNRLYIRLGLNSRGGTFYTPSKKKEDYSACMLRKAEQTLLRLCSVLLDTNTAFLGLSSIINALVISAKEMPKNQADKECFPAASSCIETAILTLLFPRKRRRSSRLSTTAF